MRMKTLATVAAVVVATGAIGSAAAVGSLAADDPSTASCTSTPAIVETETGSQITVECTVPRPAPVTETVTTPGPTVTITPTPSSTPTTSPTPSEPPSSTPTVTPTPTATPTVTPPPTTGYPDASTTGAKGTLTVSTGSRTISTNGTVVQNVEIRGGVLITANNVTLRNVRIISNDFWPLRITGTGTLIEDSTITGGNNSQASIAGSFTGRRLNLSGAGDGVKMHSNSVLEDSFIHDLASFDGAHNDGLEATNAVNVRIVHNTILNQNGQTSAIMLSEYGTKTDTNVLVQGNLFAGGGFTLYGGAPDTAAGHEVVDNVFSTRYFSRAGYYGAVAYWRPTGNTWARNTWLDGPNAGKPVTP